MKVTYTKVDGKLFSIYTDKLTDIQALLFDANIQHLECFFVTPREKQTLCKFFKKKYLVQKLDLMRSVRVYKK
jgi:hypothetical protein